VEHEHDIQLASVPSPSGAEKLLQALELMDIGLRLKRAALIRQHPHASEAELEQLYRQWLLDDD
jgi:hypothetical protein